MNKTVSNIIIVVTLLFVVGVAGRYAYTEYPMLFGILPVEEPTLAPQYTGSLIMTLQPATPVDSMAAMYAVSPANASIKKINDSNDFYAPSFSTDGRVAVVSSVASSSWQLVIAKVNDRDTQMTVVPPSPTLSPGASSWSPDNRYVAYEAVTALPSENDIDIANSRIVLLDIATGVQKILDTGASPLFMKDGSVIYIKVDGVYRIAAENLAAVSPADTAARVTLFGEYQATRSARIALSHNETTVVVSLLQSGGSLVYQVKNDPKFYLSEIKRIAGRVLFPVFSPDDRSLAFISLAEDKEGHLTKSLVIEDVRSFAPHTVMDLSGYTDELLSLSAWVK